MAYSRWGKAWRIVLVAFAALCGAMLAVLVGDAVVRSRVPASLPSGTVYVGDWSNGWVLMQGTWMIEGDVQAKPPLQASEISCRRHTGFCLVATAKLAEGRLQLESDNYPILRWNDDTLVFGSSADAIHVPNCVDYVFTVSRGTRQVAGVRRMKANAVNDASCKQFNSELRLRLSDSYDAWWRLREEARPETLLYLMLGFVLSLGLYGIWRIVRSPRASQ